eukprot:TRINITY_DN1209_c0_g1_i1.p1 TRINITY_DN1209_c0_g1~~TRINITY_DN1209_c0_g1_i1.p1  ORF type:complete len:482 (-),score=45.85 TRINITY_DN1209_c0_g1_i1:25-1470(-)
MCIRDRSTGKARQVLRRKNKAVVIERTLPDFPGKVNSFKEDNDVKSGVLFLFGGEEYDPKQQRIVPDLGERFTTADCSVLDNDEIEDFIKKTCKVIKVHNQNQEIPSMFGISFISYPESIGRPNADFARVHISSDHSCDVICIADGIGWGKASSAAAEAACNSFIKLSQAWLKTQLYNDIDFKDLISFLFSTPSRISAELVGDLKGTQEMFDIGTSSIAGGLLFRVNISRTPHSVIRKFLCQRKIRDTKETNKPKRPKQKKDNESQTQDDGDRKAFKRVDFLQVLPLELLVKIFNSVTDINTFMGLRLVCKMSMEVLNQIPIPPLVLYTAVCLGGDRIFAVTKEGRAEEITRFRWAGDDSYAGRVGPYTADGDFDERTLEVVWHCFFPGDFLLLLTDGIYNNLWKHVPKSSENTFKRRILRGLQRLIDKLPRPLTPESIAKSLARHAILNTKLAREQVANGSRAEIECGYLDHSTCLVLQI